MTFFEEKASKNAINQCFFSENAKIPFPDLRRAKKRVALRLKNEGKSDDRTHPQPVVLVVVAEAAIAEAAMPAGVGVVLGGCPTVGLRGVANGATNACVLCALLQIGIMRTSRIGWLCRS